MNANILHLKRALRAALLVLLLSAVGMTNAQEPSDYSQEYFTITSWEPDNTITFYHSNASFTMYISYDKTNWSVFSNQTNTNSSFVLGVGEKAYFKAEAKQMATTDTDNNGRFGATKLFEASGNIMSLFKGDNFVGATTFYSANDTYAYNLFAFFNGATTLLTLENLVLPITQYNKWVLQGFASGCTSLIKAPKELPAQTYQGRNTLVWMFSGCTKLQESPVIRLTSNASGDGWYGMFGNCSSLKRVICLMEGSNLRVTGASYWLNGVPSGGVFYKNSSSTWQSGNHAIPSTWTTRNWSENSSDFVAVTSTPAYRYSCYVEGTSNYYKSGDNVTLKCTPINGYTFNGWYVDGALVSTNDTYSFIASENIEVTPSFVTQAPAPTGAINGIFSVSDSTQVYFSQGNLQYIGSAETPYWKFADHQWDCLGTTTGQNSADQNVDRDLFGWGTSGYDHGATCYQPWSTSESYSDYFAYGSGTNNLFDQTAQADWGYNDIINGGNIENQWRTLEIHEWDYLWWYRPGIRYAHAQVNDVNGTIIFPDTWDTTYYKPNNYNSDVANCADNVLTIDQWLGLEQHGAVFLPAAGYRRGTSVNDVGSGAIYWSSTRGDNYAAMYTYPLGNYYYWGRYNGFSVRLVHPVDAVTSYYIGVVPNPAEGGTVTGTGTYNLGETATMIAAANEGYVFVNWTEGGEVVSTEAIYSFIVTGSRDLVANFTADSGGYHWTVNPNQFPNNMVVIGIIQIEGVEQATTALELGAFCGDTCRGRERLVYVPDFGRYLLYLTLYGENGDVISFRLYNHAIGEEVDKTCVSTITFESDNIVGSVIAPFMFNFVSAVTQTTHFNSGWTWWSTYVEQNGNDGLVQLETGLDANGILIKGQSSGSVMYMSGGWYGNLPALNNEDSYRVKTNVPTDVDIVGDAVLPSEHPITLNPGWTWIGFPSQTAISIDEALAGITPTDFDMLKSQVGSVTYMYGNWYGSLNTLTPGEGLMYKSNSSENITLTFPSGGAKGELRPNLTAENNHWQPNLSAYPDNMTVIAVVEFDEEEPALQQAQGPDETYELAAFANGECRGSVRLLYVEPLNRYVAFLTVAGDEIAELRFGLFNTETGEEYHNAEETLTYESNAVVGNLDAPYVIRFRSNTGLDDLNNRIQVFPNPVERGQTFNIGMTDAEIGEAQEEIINALGVVVETRRATSL